MTTKGATAERFCSTMLNLPGGIVAGYTYDGAGQLTGMVYTRGGVTIGDLAYQYDAAGRRIRESGSLARRNMPTAVTSATYNAAHQLMSWGGTPLAYDANGNLTSDGSRAFTWDSRNRLKTISGATTASFGYDAFGRRSSRTVSGSATSFLYDGPNIVQELTGATVKATLLGGLGLDEIFRRTDAAGPRSYLTDGLGSTLAMTDDAGVLRTQYRYDPYGSTVASGDASSNPFQYTGRENDGTGLYHYRARYYSPNLGRFISEDPIGLEGGLNLYSYVGQDPLNNIDPYGQAVLAIGPVLEFTPGAGGLAGFGIAISFPTPWDDSCVPWDIGAFGTISGRVGLSAGFSVASFNPTGSLNDFRGGFIDAQIGGSIGPISAGYAGAAPLLPGQGIGPWGHGAFGQAGPSKGLPGLPAVGLPKLGGRVGASAGLTFTGVSSLNGGSGSDACGCN